MALSWRGVQALAAVGSEPRARKELAAAWAACAEVLPRTTSGWVASALQLGLLAASGDGVAPAVVSADPVDHLVHSGWVRLGRAAAAMDVDLGSSELLEPLRPAERRAVAALGRRLQEERPLGAEAGRELVAAMAWAMAQRAPEPLVGAAIYREWRRLLVDRPAESKRFGEYCIDLDRAKRLDVGWAQYLVDGFSIDHQAKTSIGYVGSVRLGARSAEIETTREQPVSPERARVARAR